MADNADKKKEEVVEEETGNKIQVKVWAPGKQKVQAVKLDLGAVVEDALKAAEIPIPNLEETDIFINAQKATGEEEDPENVLGMELEDRDAIMVVPKIEGGA